MLTWMPPAWSAPQADQKQKDSPDPNESSSQRSQGPTGRFRSDSTPDQQTPDQKPSDQKIGRQGFGWSSSSSHCDCRRSRHPPQELPKYNPLPAEQDVDVGTYYMHKGDSDAAIGRFEDAIQLKADYAKPRMLLAQIYEKKGDKANAVKYYKEYLQVYPHAPDAKKVQAKIEKLTTR